jgi:AcrR family transcriptional regulator
MTRNRMHSGDPKRNILAVAGRILREAGPSALTFDAVAAKLGVSKQAVIYWYRSKAELLAALALPAIEAEVAVVVEACAAAQSPREAVADSIIALTAFHLSDLARFRLIYIAPQIGRPQAGRQLASVLSAKIHPITQRMYTALADAMGGGVQARRRAMAVHMAALGQVLMLSLADAIGDPLAHATDDLQMEMAQLMRADFGS